MNVNLEALPHLGELFDKLRSGRHLCADDGSLYLALRTEFETYHAIFAALDFELVQHERGFCYFRSEAELGKEATLLAVFFFVLVEAWCDAGIDVALWASGRLDGRVLQWLAGQDGLRALHVGDYDPVGLDEYLRVRAAFGERADLHVPDDFEERVARYGQREVLVRSLPVYKRVRQQADERVQVVLDTLDRHGKGLEQEALFIKNKEK